MDSDQTPVVKADLYSKLIEERLKDVGLEPCGMALGCDKSTVSRLRDQVSRFAKLLEVLDLKVVGADRVCVKEQQFLEMTRIASRAMAHEETARMLFFDDAE